MSDRIENDIYGIYGRQRDKYSNIFSMLPIDDVALTRMRPTLPQACVQ